MLKVGKCKLLCTIAANDIDWCWYYFTCKKCKKPVLKAPKEENAKNKKTSFWCQSCREDTFNVIPR